ncbi:hypothetical protein EVAR_52583_1 [Eumeta japonica]|uniref:Uncharacterized protein n=1 Tax=Eumeta variegata TaxID=151549 RepID=A0A4C1YAR4_EUMVA|nr:hypothetical protein EVAR_52583_1 [Eumeta japonica]
MSTDGAARVRGQEAMGPIFGLSFIFMNRPRRRHGPLPTITYRYVMEIHASDIPTYRAGMGYAAAVTSARRPAAERRVPFDFEDEAPSKTTFYHFFSELNRGRSMLMNEFEEGHPKSVAVPQYINASVVWVFQDEPNPTKVIRAKSTLKQMVACFFGINGHLLIVPLENRKTVNSEWYTTICLPEVFEEFRLFLRCDRSPSVQSPRPPFILVCYCVSVFLRNAFRSVGFRACRSVWSAAQCTSRGGSQATLTSSNLWREVSLRVTVSDETLLLMVNPFRIPLHQNAIPRRHWKRALRFPALRRATATYKRTTYQLNAAKGTTVNIYGYINLELDLSLRQDYPWRFVVADVTKPIIGADFLQFYSHMVDIRNRRLIDNTTTLFTSKSETTSSSMISSVKILFGDTR